MTEREVTPEWRRQWYLTIGSIVMMQVTSSTIYMTLPLFFSSVGVGKSENGFLISIGTFAGIISGLIAGASSNRFGRKKILILAALIYSLTFFMLVFMGRDFYSLLFSRFIAGIGFYMMPVMVTTMAADIFPFKERGRAMALYGSSGGVGALIGPLMTPYLVHGNDYTWYFVFSGASVLVSAIAMIFLVKETLPPEIKEKARVTAGKKFDIKEFATSLKGLGIIVLVFLIAVTMYRTGYTMIDPFLSLYLKEVLNLDLGSVSYIYALRALCTIIFSQGAGWLIDKYGRKKMFMIGLGMTCITTFSYTITQSFVQMLFLRSWDAAANAVTLTSIRTLVADLLSPEMRAFGMGLYSATTQQSSTVGSIFSGFIIDSFGYSTTFYTATILCLISFFVVLLFVPEPGKAKAAKPPGEAKPPSRG
ncbi:MAG: MFS transporter [Candidatus Bathyarchaeota archaeon]|nr:MFS transporter [Candidatus Bathyarchaeota archaeon]